MLREIEAGNIIVNPFNPDLVSVNSIDVRLGPDLYRMLPPKPLSFSQSLEGQEPEFVNPYGEPEERYERVSFNAHRGGNQGWILEPGFYLGSTVEEIGTSPTSGLCPDINAKSTFGRNGLTVAVCAGKGDVGYAARWTLEIHVREPVLLLVNSVIAQVRFSRVEWTEEDAQNAYGGKSSYQPNGEIRMLPKPIKVLNDGVTKGQ
jgi:dCTP deaminase